MTIHIRPTAPLAERALLPEDPGAALALARALLERPLMFNHSHGLWGYTGTAADGGPLTIQSTGIGAPSAVIVLQELSTLGLRRAVRVGTCAALVAGLEPGELVVAGQALVADGASRALTAAERVDADGRLTARLRAAGPQARHGLVVSSDLFYDPDGDARMTGEAWRVDGALAVEMGAAALFALGARRGVAIGCVLAVAERPGPDDDGPGADADAAAAAALERAGRLGLSALAPAG